MVYAKTILKIKAGIGPFPSADSEKASECVNQDPTVLAMQAVSPMYAAMPPQDATLSLVGFWWDGVNRAQADSRFLALNAERNACTQAHGYSVYYPVSDGIGFLSYDDNWTPEQRLMAEVAEAQCSDDMGYTQQIIDMISTYQLETISQHEAELVADKSLLDQRVSDATAMLSDLGLI